MSLDNVSLLGIAVDSHFADESVRERGLFRRLLRGLESIQSLRVSDGPMQLGVDTPLEEVTDVVVVDLNLLADLEKPHGEQ